MKQKLLVSVFSSILIAGGLTGTIQADDHLPDCVYGAASDSDGDGYGWEDGKSCIVSAGVANICGIITHADLTHALESALSTKNGGLDFAMWATLVDRHGVVCHVTRASGLNGDDPWPGSRVISAQKANTANAFSNKQLALSTANLFSAVQPGGSLFGLQHSNPVDTEIAYRGSGSKFGSYEDPMQGGRIGGVNVFGGGVAIYLDGEVVGAIGVSGDTSCADHNIAWKTRQALSDSSQDFTPTGSGVGGVNPNGTDDIIFDAEGGDENGVTDGFEHAANCPGAPLDYVPNTTGS